MPEAWDGEVRIIAPDATGGHEEPSSSRIMIRQDPGRAAEGGRRRSGIEAELTERERGPMWHRQGQGGREFIL